MKSFPKILTIIFSIVAISECLIILFSSFDIAATKAEVSYVTQNNKSSDINCGRSLTLDQCQVDCGVMDVDPICTCIPRTPLNCPDAPKENASGRTFENVVKEMNPSTPALTIPDIKFSIGNFTKKNFSSVTCQDGSDCSIPWIGEYLAAIYKYLIGIVGIISAIVMMFAGVRWLTAGGDTGATKDSQEWIKASLTGLTIALSSYFILFTINPELVNFKPLTIKTVKSMDLPEIEGDTDGGYVGSNPGGPFVSGTTADLTRLSDHEIYCSGSNDRDEIYKIAMSYQGKATYRLGSKDGKTGDNHKNGGACPPGTVCYDCSGFVRQVLKCAGYEKDPGLSTAVMFNPCPETISDIDPVSNTINGRSLTPGDLVGWSTNGKGNNGHVLIYIGNGTIAEVRGGSGRSAGQGFNTRSIADFKSYLSNTNRAGTSNCIKRVGT